MFRTDLAVELRENVTRSDGIKVNERNLGEISVSTIEITDEQTAKEFSKPMGTYTTVTTPPIGDAGGIYPEALEVLHKEIAALLPENGEVLVVGLGNTEITPDALGPKVISQVLATRHIQGEIAESVGLGGIRPVAAIAPGVLGQTGMETGEIVSSIVKETKPSSVIVIDALASRSLSRLGCTIQLCNTGISPGSGVHNRRKELSKETLGVPVIAIGMPTVVDAVSLAGDLLHKANIDSHEEITKQIEPHGEAMIVTPRDIDLIIERCAKLISSAINKSLHPNISDEDMQFLVSG